MPFVHEQLFPSPHKQGQNAFWRGDEPEDNPFNENPQYAEWMTGYDEAAEYSKKCE